MPVPQSYLEVRPATADQQPILANLLELYAHDFSEFRILTIGDKGRFGYHSLPLYWSDPQRHPFLIRADGQWAGFALVQKSEVCDMTEFFILRGCRRNGLGTRAAHEIWRRFPGYWQVRVMEANAPAQRFWSRAIAAFAGQAVTPSATHHHGIPWSVFSFESKPAV
jgi:predicted acetyltransferase